MSTKKYNHKAIFGEVTHVDGRIIESIGKYIVEARVRTEEGKVWLCIIWEDLGERFMNANLLNKKVTIEGNLKGDNEINVKFFDGDGKTRTGPLESRKLTQEQKKEFREYLERHNMVMVAWTSDGVTKVIPQAKKDCLIVNGVWKAKIEYVLEVLGASEVNRRLRDFEGKLYKINPVDFNFQLDQMIEECKQQTKEKVDIWI